MPTSSAEIAALNELRALLHRPPLAPHEIAALTYEPAAQTGPAAPPPPSAEESEALAFIRGLQGRPSAAGRIDLPALPRSGRVVGGVLDKVRHGIGASTDPAGSEEREALAYLRRELAA
jgi:hypothetical protein